MSVVIGVIAQDYPPCETMERQPGTNGASWQQGAIVTVIINSTDFPPGSPQREKIEDAFRVWQNANTNSGVTFKFTSGSAAPTGSAATNTHYINKQSTSTPGTTSISNTGTPTTQGNITTSARTSVHSSMTNSQAIFNVMLHEIGHTFGLDHCPECAEGSSIMTAYSADCSCPSFPCDQNVPFNGARFGCPPLAGPRDCDENAVNTYANYSPTTPSPTPTPQCEFQICDTGCHWDCGFGDCLTSLNQQCYGTPILVDVLGNGIDLTDLSNGVLFDLASDGVPEFQSWTAVGSDDAWLVLDRNGNGVIDNGQELFGNFTPQSRPPAGQSRNGFLALAEYDKPTNGGNYDGKINKYDSVFPALRLWCDANHNGRSEANELLNLTNRGLADIELAYKLSQRIDRYGNKLRYRAKIRATIPGQIGRWAWDVILIAHRERI